MTWVDRVTNRMRRCTLLREQLGDHSSPPNEIYRPVGMKRRDYQRKVALLQRLEDSYTAELEFKLGKWHKRKLKESNTTAIQGNK
jgi:hypothetical protein